MKLYSHLVKEFHILQILWLHRILDASGNSAADIH